MIYILHLSDIHFGTHNQADKYRIQLQIDLEKNLNVDQLDYLVISGDIANKSTKDEYDAAFVLINGLVNSFKLDASRCVIVPGNHDVNGDLSADAYENVTKDRLPVNLTEEYILLGEAGGLKRNNDRYKKRFDFFSKFYEDVCGKRYPIDYSKQGILYPQHKDKILFIGFNSSWEIDHYYRKRASINMDSIVYTFDQIKYGDYENWLKIAVWHHPVTGKEMMNDEFLQLLATNGFEICIHGHIHKNTNDSFKYDYRSLKIIGAGTFGASMAEQVPRIPLQYNLLKYNPQDLTIIVETRKKEEANGAWKADSRWGDDQNNPEPRYTITLRPTHGSIKEQVLADNLPLRPSLCIGRDKVICETLQQLLSGHSTYIYGPPGVGKTTLASEVAWLFKEHSRGFVIYVFCDTKSGHTYNDILNIIARFFSENTLIEFDQYDKEREIKSLLTRNHPVLIYLDNVENSELIHCITGLSRNCSMIITGREYIPLSWILGKELGMLDLSSSIKLFKEIYNQPLSDDDKEHIKETCEMLGYMPLAIDLCAHRTKVSKLSISSLPSLLRVQLLKIVKFKNRSVEASINLTYENLGNTTKHFFAMLSLFGGRAFGLEAVAAMWGEEDAIDLQNQLTDLSLVKPVGGGRYVLHPVIHEFATKKNDESIEMSDYLYRMIEYFCMYAEKNRMNFELLEIERENIFAVMNECYERTEVENYLRIADALLKKLPGYYAYGFMAQKGFWDEALAILMQCLKLTNDTVLEAKLYEHLGLFYYWKGEHKEANEAYEKALSLCQKLNDYQGEAVIIQRQGFIQSDEGFYEECERLYRRSVEIAREHELSNKVLADGIHLVGVILYHQCRYEESKENLEEALLMRDTHSVAASVTLRRLAGTYRMLGQIKKAEDILCDCLEVEKAEGNERNIARCFRQLGMVRQRQGLIDDALSCFEESYKIFRKIGNNKGIASVLTSLGEINFKRGNLDEAESRLHESLNMAKNLGSTYGVAINLKWISEIHYSHSKYRLSAENAIESLRHFELIRYIHVESICSLINKAVVMLNIDETHQISTSNIFINEQCSKKTEEKFKVLKDEALPHLLANDLSIDEHLSDLSNDNRLGISLITRPSEEIQRLVTRVRDRLRKVAPNHHYYDPSEYHVTVMTLISAIRPMDIEKIPIEQYKDVLSSIISGHRPLRIHFRGIGFTKECMIAHGFFRDGTLDKIRMEIRKVAPKLGIVGEIENRYRNISAHISFVRFRSQDNLKKMIEIIDSMKSCELGVFYVDKVDLVLNDWYMTKDKVQVLKSFGLR
ncbi:MAG: tetratricopeptide repeat protein [Candidatus Scalindua sp.]